MTAEAHNRAFLENLSGQAQTFRADIYGQFTEAQYPADQPLSLKIGARVLLTSNDPAGAWVNGYCGDVVGWSDGYDSVGGDWDDIEDIVARMASGGAAREPYIAVQLDRGDVVRVRRERWQTGHLKMTDRLGTEPLFEHVTTGSFIQFPLRLGWALTIYKSQGMTLQKVFIDLSRGTFEHGQLYVALSRAQTLDGLALSRPITTTDLSNFLTAAAPRGVWKRGG